MSNGHKLAWMLPPENIRQRVNAAFGGTDQYVRLANAWNRAVRNLPDELVARIEPESQYRAWVPQGTSGPVDPESVHLLGLARDAGWQRLQMAERIRVARALAAQPGMIVENLAGGAWREGQKLAAHLHFGIPKAQVRAQGLGGMLTELSRRMLRRAR